jgi:hypothetical protein
MLTENRKYDSVGDLILHRSRVLNERHQPKDDESQQYSFVYKIENPSEANYKKTF